MGLAVALSMHEGEASDNAGGGGGGGLAAVDGEDGVQWRRWWGRSMAKSAAQ